MSGSAARAIWDEVPPDGFEAIGRGLAADTGRVGVGICVGAAVSTGVAMSVSCVVGVGVRVCAGGKVGNGRVVEVGIVAGLGVAAGAAHEASNIIDTRVSKNNRIVVEP